MKKFKIYALSSLLLGLGACEDGDNAIDQLFETTERGAVLRSVEVVNQEYSVTDPESEFIVILEEQDVENGGLLESVDVFVTFVDNSPGRPDNNDYSRDEALVENIPASAFGTSDLGLPQITYSLTLAEAAAAAGVTDQQYDGSDYFDIRFALKLTDGRVFSFNDVNGSVRDGSFFASRFLYRVPIVCPPDNDAPTEGTWTIDGQDSYGDGWNGASLDVLIDGELAVNFFLPDGDTGSTTFDVPAGATTIEFFYNSGDWDSEVTFQVISANGNTVIDIGPTPPAGVALIDYCVSDL